MPTIAWFYGIAIRMFHRDHDPPHLLAQYRRAKALIALSNGEILAGELPPTARRMVREWTLARRVELEENWRRARAQQPLEKVAGPDAGE
jgi:hypothetical protein